jgi:hypothetical protein
VGSETPVVQTDKLQFTRIALFSSITSYGYLQHVLNCAKRVVYLDFNLKEYLTLLVP